MIIPRSNYKMIFHQVSPDSFIDNKAIDYIESFIEKMIVKLDFSSYSKLKKSVKHISSYLYKGGEVFEERWMSRSSEDVARKQKFGVNGIYTHFEYGSLLMVNPSAVKKLLKAKANVNVDESFIAYLAYILQFAIGEWMHDANDIKKKTTKRRVLLEHVVDTTGKKTTKWTNDV